MHWSKFQEFLIRLSQLIFISNKINLSKLFFVNNIGVKEEKEERERMT